MTGYAKKECTIGTRKITVEIKTLNGKQLDIAIKLPVAYRGKELELRTMASKLERGKVDILVTEENTVASNTVVNTALVTERFAAIKEVMETIGISQSQMGHVVEAILNQSDVWNTVDDKETNEEEWQAMLQCMEQAITECKAFRRHEGEVLKVDLTKHVDAIEARLHRIPQYEQERIDTVKEHLRKDLAELAQNSVDQNRFEQEIIYYLEKLDITEEKVRLAKHIAYFRDTMESSESNGKKLAFIAQEMGREINTTGSKANHVEIQRLVVEMKDELEKIKEQLANIL